MESGAPTINSSTDKQLEDNFNQLMNSYLDVLEKSKNDPILSIKGFVTFYFKLFWGEINLILLPFIIVINFFIFIINQIREPQINYIASVFIRYIKDIHQSLKSGEVPALQFFTIRYFTNLFIQLHIKNRLGRINKALATQKLRATINISESNNLSSVTTLHNFAESLNKIISPGIELKITFSFILPFLGFLKSLFRLNLDEINIIEYITHHINTHVIFNVIAIFVYLLSLVVSCFIRKRKILLEAGIYHKEQILSVMLKEKIGFEFPLDLVGWIALVLFLVTPYIFLPLKVDYSQIIFLSIIYASPFIYALYKRIKLKNL